MSQPFDPYYKWLGIPPDEQPPTHYRLLGLRKYEADPDVIEHAADRLMSHMRTLQVGQRAADSQKILNEVAAARITLLDANKKHHYDAVLRQAETPLPRLPDPPQVPREPVVRLQPEPSNSRHLVAATASILAMAVLAVGVLAVAVIVVIAMRGWSRPRASDSAPAAAQAAAKRIPPQPPLVPKADDSGESGTATKSAGTKAGVLAATAGADVKPKAPTAESKRTGLPQTPIGVAPEPNLVFDFSDEAHLKQHWEWNNKWTFAADGGRAGRGPRSFFRSKQQFQGDLTVDMQFRFGQAGYSNTGGCWVELWGKRLLITNGWRSLNANIHIERQGNTIVYVYNGKERRIEVPPDVIAQPTILQIRWRSRSSHFKRIEVKAERLLNPNT